MGIEIVKETNEECKKNLGQQTLKQEDGENLTIYGYKKNALKTWTIYILYILTFGLLRLVFHWCPRWKLYSTHTRCSLNIANQVLVVDKYQDKFESYFVEEVKIISASNSSVVGDSKAVSYEINQEMIAMDSRSKLSVFLGHGYLKEMEQFRAVWCKRLCYIWDEKKGEFVKLVGLDQGKTCLEYRKFNGYSKQQQYIRLLAYGTNEINVPVNSILKLLMIEALTPFYMFQVFSLIVWFCEYYYYYTIAIILMSVFGITSSIIQTRRNQQSLHKTVQSAQKVIVCRGEGHYEEISSSDLVPGDIIEIPKTGGAMNCDAILLEGSCVVNESMLTGESVPVTKTSLHKTNATYNVIDDSSHTLFCGTDIIQTRNGSDRILAVVIRTGFLTSKGTLVRSILYPPPSDFKFERDSYKFIGILTIIALLGCVYTVVSKSERAIAAGDIIIKALDLITILVPPALPAAMTVGKLYALNRLKKQDIFCVNSRVINVSGSIDCVCFDKTGTLTEDCLDMWGVVSINNNNELVNEPITSLSNIFLRGMATCHSLTLVNDDLVGDPLDVKVFESTGWILEEESVPSSDFSDVSNFNTGIYRNVRPTLTNNPSDTSQNRTQILRQYQFSSKLQRMSVLTKTDDTFEVYCKGSPEMIISLSKPESVPLNIQERLKEFTEKGYRVIALATKTIERLAAPEDVEKLERTVAECDFVFLGLVILENRIKAETSSVIKVLKNANIKTMMVTGDNIQTALSVAEECGIVDKNRIVVHVAVDLINKPTLSFSILKSCHQRNGGVYSSNENDMETGNFIQCHYYYVITGTNWSLVREYFPEKLPELATNGVVFARMSGEQKQQLIEELKKVGYYVAMCGDGANDCGALKAAHVGISLSEEESSVAAPLTSKQSNISCVPKVIKEGRAALTTSIGVFKFMVCYSLTQFTSVIILYGIDSNLTSLQFLFIDVCLILHFMSFFGKTEAFSDALDKRRPPTTLLSVISLGSIMWQMLVAIVFQILSYKIIQMFDWFVPFVFDPENTTYYTCYENYAVFSLSLFQYIIMVVTFSKGKPFRKPFYTNRILLSSIIVMMLICAYVTAYPANWIVYALELIIPPTFDMSLVILGLVVGNFICSLLGEELLVDYVMDKTLKPALVGLIKRKTKCKNNQNYKYVECDKFTEVNSKLQNGCVNYGFRNVNAKL